MTKQEKIRQEIHKLAIEAVCPYSMKPSTPYEIGAVKIQEFFGMQIVKYIVSQGLVLKVDRELPKNPYRKANGKYKYEEQPYEADGYAAGQQDMLKAGFDSATESLIL